MEGILPSYIYLPHIFSLTFFLNASHASEMEWSWTGIYTNAKLGTMRILVRVVEKLDQYSVCATVPVWSYLPGYAHQLFPL